MIIFSSNHHFETLYNCLKDDFEIKALVTAPPKPMGRGLKKSPNEAHRFAIKQDLKVFLFPQLNRKSGSIIQNFIESNNIKYALVDAYGKIIPRHIINLFHPGILNIHPSLLPRYRGPAPLSSAILNRDSKSGYTIIQIDDGCDTGDIVAQQEVEILPDDSYSSLERKIYDKLHERLSQIIKKYYRLEIKPTKQSNKGVIVTKKVSADSARLTSDDRAETAYAKYLAYEKWPKPYFIIDNKRFIVTKASLKCEKLEIATILPEGKGEMSFRDFKNGYQKLLTKLPDFVKL